jgi:hypothetical protein
MGVVMIAKDELSVLNGPAQRHLEALCATPVSHGASNHQEMLSSMMTKPTLAFGWRTTTLHAGQAGQTTIFSSSSSTLSIRLNLPRPG